ncbi:hypothetical protein EMIT0P258_20399 [Pseudomonas sp. IT-P258]
MQYFLPKFEHSNWAFNKPQTHTVCVSD